MEVVYNACYGGFSLSEEAIARYAEIKGLTLYKETGAYGLVTYWIVPPEKRIGSRDAMTLKPRDISRCDPVLVQVVKELGDKANGRCAALKIADVASGQRYRIDEYDGAETVMTVDDYEWEIAT